MHGQEVVTITCTDRNRYRLKFDVEVDLALEQSVVSVALPTCKRGV